MGPFCGSSTRSRNSRLANFCTFPGSSAPPSWAGGSWDEKVGIYLSPRSQISRAGSVLSVLSLPEERGCLQFVHRPERASRASSLQEGTWPLQESLSHTSDSGKAGPGRCLGGEGGEGGCAVSGLGSASLPASRLGACSTSVWLLFPRVGPQCGEIASSLQAALERLTGIGGYLIGAQSRSPAFPDSWHPLTATDKVIHAPFWPGSEALCLPKATYKTNKELIVSCATFRRHIVQRLFKSLDSDRVAFQGYFQGEEKTCVTPESQGPGLFEPSN